MKLVDILARELDRWVDWGDKIVQDDDGYIVAFEHEAELKCVDGDWKGPSCDPICVLDLAEDHKTSIVTRAEWQAAVDALNAPKVVDWDGVGRPPEGTVCGLWYKGCDQGECTVLFMGAEVGVFKSHAFDHEQHGDLVHYSFYKVENSTEEKEVQERKKVIAEMTTIAGGQYSPRDSIVQRLYDAGFRKQVTK